MEPGWIVVLNGAPRSGKSSLVREIQATFEGVWVNLGVDLSMAGTPARFRPGIGLRPGGERPDLEPVAAALYRALFDAAAVHGRQGLNVAMDVGIHDDYAAPLDVLTDARRRLAGLPVLFVGVRCPVETVMARREATGMAAPKAMVERWEQAVHAGKDYDLEIDTSLLPPAEGARAIWATLRKSTWVPR